MGTPNLHDIDGRRPALTGRNSTRPPLTNFYAQLEAELDYLRKIARRWCQETANSEDLVQDTILLALANAEQWQPGSSLRAWLFTIMRNRFFAVTNRSRRSAQAIGAIGLAAIDESVVERPEVRLMIRDVERAMLRLSSEQRMAIQLIGIEGRSYDEAALQMGLSVAALRCHLSRGRQRLRSAVQGTEAHWSRRETSGQRLATDLMPAL